MEWLKFFLELANRQMLPKCPGIVDCILPAHAYQDERKQCRECARQVDSLLKSLIKSEDDEPRYIKTRAQTELLEMSKCENIMTVVSNETMEFVCVLCTALSLGV